MIHGFPKLATAVNSSADPRVLQTLGMEGVSVVLWERKLPPQLQQWLDALPCERLPQLRRRVTAVTAATAVRAACIEAGAPGEDGRNLLGCETAALARIASEVLASPLLDLTISATRGEARPKWHAGAVRGRLICTLRGPGTEYAPMAGESRAQAVHRMRRGTVGVFRGVLWPGPELGAIVHRSPPRDEGRARLLVVIDPVDEAGSC